MLVVLLPLTLLLWLPLLLLLLLPLPLLLAIYELDAVAGWLGDMNRKWIENWLPM